MTHNHDEHDDLSRADAEAPALASNASPETHPETHPEISTRMVWNPLAGAYVAQAPGRMHRRQLTADCPFCADLSSGRVAAETQAWIRPNDFPPFVAPIGEAYILIYSQEHQRTFADLTVAEAVRVIGLWQTIYRDLSPRYACVMTWETFGEAIGQTQRHPHGQTYAVSFLPDTLARELTMVTDAEARGEECPFCVERRRESGGPRMVIEGEDWLGFVPEYARYPYQVHLVPRAHVSAITALTAPNTMEELASALPRVLRAYNQIFQGPMPYMLVLHQLADARFHLHIELLPVGRAPGKLKLAASAEMGFGLWTNDSVPETTAAELRAYLGAEPR